MLLHVGSFTIFSPCDHDDKLISFVAIISFLGAFFLIRYKLAVAQHDEDEAEHEIVDSPTSISSDPEKRASVTIQASGLRTSNGRGRVRVRTDDNQIIWTTNPHLVQVGPFQGKPSTELLSRCHALCVFLTFLGLLLAVTGLMSFAWDRLPLSIGISASVAMGFCLIAGALILFLPLGKTPRYLRS